MGYCPFLVLCRDREFQFSIATEGPGRDRAVRTVTEILGVCGGEHALESFLALCLDTTFLCHDRVPRHAKWLGRDRGFLYRDRALLALCRDHGLCHDRVWSRLGGLVS